MINANHAMHVTQQTNNATDKLKIYIWSGKLFASDEATFAIYWQELERIYFQGRRRIASAKPYHPVSWSKATTLVLFIWQHPVILKSKIEVWWQFWISVELVYWLNPEFLVQDGTDGWGESRGPWWASKESAAAPQGIECPLICRGSSVGDLTCRPRGSSALWFDQLCLKNRYEGSLLSLLLVSIVFLPVASVEKVFKPLFTMIKREIQNEPDDVV